MKVIRDSVHGDIEFYPDEMKLVHTAGFQRLHGCRQLGLTHLVYPAAKHSRFEHVLGVMHIATKMAEHLRKQQDFFGGEERLLRILRFAALLHDMGHVPFGHTLEDEMQMPIIIPKHDEPSGEGNTSRMDAAVSEVLSESGNGEYVGPVLQVLRAIAASTEDQSLYSLVGEGEGKIHPDYLVLADIIGNTICADLLDYIRRDHMMTGIRATYDDRIFRYFAVADHHFAGKNYKRLIIKLVKNGRVRGDCLADLLDILKLRYNLSDKVLFHPQKCSADAMLIRAVAEAGLAASDLLRHSDDGLLEKLHGHPLVQRIRSRNLFKPVFQCGLDEITTFDQIRRKEDFVKELQGDYSLRTRIEKSVERAMGLTEAETSVLIFCPQPGMTLKPVRALVQWKDGTIRRLNSITDADDPLTSKQIAVLQDIYPRLWKLYLFVRPELRSRGHRIQDKFQEVLKKEAKLNATCEPALQSYLEEGCSPFQVGQLMDEMLEQESPYRRLSQEDQVKVWTKCHEKLPADPWDDRYAEPEVKVIQSRKEDAAVRNLVTDIIKSVLSEYGESNKQGTLPMSNR